MLAYRLLNAKTQPEFQGVPEPRAGPGQVVVRVAGSGLCHTDFWASCGRCHMCRSGEENHCLYQKAIRAPGVGYDGGHAAYVLVPEARSQARSW